MFGFMQIHCIRHAYMNIVTAISCFYRKAYCHLSPDFIM